MKVKKVYSKPELDIVKLVISSDVLSISDPESSIAEESGGAPPENPFGDLP